MFFGHFTSLCVEKPPKPVDVVSDCQKMIPSLVVEACFSYTANPSSYAPRLSKLNHHFSLLKQNLILFALDCERKP